MAAPLCSTTTLVQASSLLCNQDFPEMVCRISFQGATQADPLTWVDFSSRLRSFQIESGGANELEGMDTGTATVVLDDRVRDLDPFNTSSAYSPNVKPHRRLWLQSYWAGECKDQFYGWTGSFQPSWVANTDAVVAVEAQDGQSVLVKAKLPTTSPPRDTYGDLVLFEKPYIYLPFNDELGAVQLGDASGNGRSSNALASPYTPAVFKNAALLTGDAQPSCSFTATSEFDWDAGVGDLTGASSVAIDGWFNRGAAGSPAFLGPTTTAAGTDWQYGLEAASTLKAYVSTTTANYTVTSATTMAADTVYHVAMRWDGANLKAYINGVEVATTATAGTLRPVDGVQQLHFVGTSGASVQHWALYPSLTVARLQQHYTAGAARGLAIQTVSSRLDSVLDNADSFRFMPRRIRSDASAIQQTYFRGQDALEEIHRTMPVAGDPSMFFFGKDGAVVFLDSAHRSVSPWDTVQATFDDDGTDFKYLALDLDDGAQFIRNDVRGNARPITQTGDTQSSTDSTSIYEYGPTVLDLGETLHNVEADLATEVAALLAKYKDPIPRITAIHLEGSNNSGAVQTQILNRELGDKVRVFRRPVGGGSAIDQSSWIRARTVSGSAASRWWQGSWALSSRGN